MSGDFDYNVKHALLWGNCVKTLKMQKKQVKPKTMAKHLATGCWALWKQSPSLDREFH